MQIPEEMRTRLDDDYFDLSTRAVERTETQKKVALKNVQRQYLPLRAFFIDQSGALSKKSYGFIMDGGGMIDFSQYTSESKGDFLFGAILESKFNEDNTRVYFISNLKSSGCNSYMDVTSYFFDKIAKKGLITTTKDSIHLKLLSGAFVIVSNLNDRYYLGQIHLSDQRIKKFLCR